MFLTMVRDLCEGCDNNDAEWIYSHNIGTLFWSYLENNTSEKRTCTDLYFM